MDKQRDIPDESRPVAYRCYTETLGNSKMGIRVMIGLGEEFKKGRDLFWITKLYHFYVRLLRSLAGAKDEGIKRTVAKDYRIKIEERIKNASVPYFIERNFLSLLVATHRNFSNGINVVPKNEYNINKTDLELIEFASSISMQTVSNLLNSDKNDERNATQQQPNQGDGLCNQNKSDKYVWVEIPVEEDLPPIGTNIVLGLNLDYLVEAFYNGNDFVIMGEEGNPIPITESVLYWLKKVKLSSII